MEHRQWLGVQTETQHLPNGEAKLRALIKELDPVNNPRYKKVWNEKKQRWDTWCNIFVTDVTDAFGVAPTHWMNEDGSPSGRVGAKVELSANKLTKWLAQFGAEYGWREAQKNDAFESAAAGKLTLVVWDSGGAGPGHVAVLLPEGSIAQAGARNFVGEPISAGFGNLEVKFYTYEGKAK